MKLQGGEIMKVLGGDMSIKSTITLRVYCFWLCLISVCDPVLVFCQFLSDILDALFEMLQAGNQTPYYTKVFHALVSSSLPLLDDSCFPIIIP